MATKDNQLRPADEKAGDNNGRNIVRPQTQEPYGDQELAVESKVTHTHHFAGQPLETTADHEANEALRRERYERALVDPIFRRTEKIDVDPDDLDEDRERELRGLTDESTPFPAPPRELVETPKNERPSRR